MYDANGALFGLWVAARENATAASSYLPAFNRHTPRRMWFSARKWALSRALNS
jgi:hypothetical protein